MNEQYGLTVENLLNVPPDVGRLHRPACYARTGRGGARQQRV